MKCPKRYKIGQLNIRKPIINEYEETNGEYTIFIENQDFAECYKEECAEWDNKNKRCRKE